MKKKHVLGYGFLCAAASVPIVAYSSVYLTEEQSIKNLFPAESFTKIKVDLTSDEIKKIEEGSHERVRDKTVVVWVGKNKNAVFIDQVLGKHEFITVTVGVTKVGIVQGVEILEYRETYGYQIKEEVWRKQFVGKNRHAPLKVKDDITNISGATLSTTHVTSGVRRILQTHEIIKNRI